MERTDNANTVQEVVDDDDDEDEVVDSNGFVFDVRRVFDVEGDSMLEFNPREEFAGMRQGFVFRLGSKGVGYYEDKKK